MDEVKYHVPVLLDETLKYLSVSPGKKFIDCTLGGGGHTRGILSLGGEVLAIDQDTDAIKNAEEVFKQEITDKKLTLFKSNFAHLQEVVESLGFGPVAGILLDLGVSSHQLETPSRGFSFNKDATLDMRMDPVNQGVTARDLLNAAGENELANIFWRFGDETRARPIARAIVQKRKSQPIETTDDLANIVLSVRKRSPGDRTHPATRIFQALRIAVNDELASLEAVLPQTLELLSPAGRLVVISFHSLEDRIVKNFLKSNADSLRVLTEKPVIPTEEETIINPRARSGKLRASEKKGTEGSSDQIGKTAI